MDPELLGHGGEGMNGRKRTVAVIASALLGIGATQAFAAWSLSGTGTGDAAAGSLTAPGKPTAPTPTGGSVSLSWSAGSVTGGGTVEYHVERALFGTTSWADACGSTDASPITGTSCTDSTVTAETDYQYRVTSEFASWRKTSAVSDKITVPATISIAAVNGSGYTNQNKPTISGTASSGGTVTVKLCAGDVATVCGSPITFTVNPDGTSSHAWSGSAGGNSNQNTLTGNDGTWTVFATQANGASDRRTFVWDTTAPAPAIATASSSGGTGSGSGTQGGQAADATHSADNAVTVKICSGSNNSSCSTSSGSPVVTSTAGGTTWSVTWSGLSTNNPNNYTLVVTQADVAGNSKTVKANFSG